MKAFITRTFSALPNKAVNNDDIEGVLGLINNKPSRTKKIILRNNGIQTRYYALNPHTKQATHNNAQLTAQAIRGLFDDEDINKIDLIACGTTTPDQTAPSHAVMTHGELQSQSCETLSSAGICMSGLMALKYAYLAVKSGDSHKAVATGSEVVSPLLQAKNFHHNSNNTKQLSKSPELGFDKDFLRWMLSDGASALCIEPTPNQDSMNLQIDWIKTYSYANEMQTCMYSGATKLSNGDLLGWTQVDHGQWFNDSIFALKQEVKLLNQNIVKYAIKKTLLKIIAATGLKSDEIDYFLPHMSSMYFLSKIQQGLNEINFHITEEKWFTNLATKGNTGAAAMFIMIDELMRSNRLTKGERILCFVPESGRFSSGFMLLTAV